ncbi:alkaline phosphatase family protein [Candidatus Woesearchaeota archaeon]|nr:alkaline phosphatase family protein [Candidatus Woesearchaeota archaeon]
MNPPPVTMRVLEEKKYDYTIRKLALERYEKIPDKRVIIIQIDGLSYNALVHCMEKGYCRFMRSLVRDKGYHLNKYNVGIPSTTPSVQASIMYGDNSSIPGFRFVDKKKKKQYSCGNPLTVQALEELLFSKHPGIVDGGSSYCNQFSGGATRSILTMSTITKTKRLHRIKETTLWAFLLLNPVSLIRVLHYTFAEFFLEVFESVYYKLKATFDNKHAHFGLSFPLRRVFVGAIFQELITIGTIIDIKRSVPRIYVNFNGYDDLTHKRGPKTRSVYIALRAIDRRIKRIYERTKGRYEFNILSDHGQVDSVPFRKIEGMEIDEYLRMATQVEAEAFASMHEGRLSLTREAFNKATDAVQTLSAPLRCAATGFMHWFSHLSKQERKDFIWDNKEKIFVETSSCLAHMYFNITTKTMNLSEIKKRYPDLIFNLLRSKAIGLVIGREGKDIHVLHRDGSLVIGRGVKRTGLNFLKTYGDEDLLIKQFKYFLSIKNCGDLILFGDYDGLRAVSFAEHYGTHGSAGGDMCEAFFLSKGKYNIEKSLNANVINKIIMNASRGSTDR